MKKKINKITIVWENLEYGGMNTFLEGLINSYEFKNIKINLVTNQNNEGIKSLKNNIKKKNYTLTKFNSFNSLKQKKYMCKLFFWTFRPFLLILSLIQIFLILKKQKPEIVIAVCGGYGGFRADAGSLIFAQILNIKSRILCIHHCYTRPIAWEFFSKFLDKYILNSCTSIIFNSKAVRKSIKLNTCLLINNKKNKVIYNGVSSKKNYFNKINLDKVLKVMKKNTIRAGIISRVEYEKGHYDLIDAFYDLPDNIKIAFKIFFIGPINHYNKQLINLKLRKLGLKKFFKITGFIKCDSSKIMKKLDIVFSLTKSFEGFGLSIAEALLAKKPVIATKVGGVTEFLNNNNSKLIEPNNKKAIKSSIIDFYNNKKKWKKKSINGFKLMKKKYTSKISSRNYFNFLLSNYNKR